MCVYRCVYVYICEFVSVCEYIGVFVSVCVCTCVYVYVCASAEIRVRVCPYVRVCTCVRVCACVRVCVRVVCLPARVRAFLHYTFLARCVYALSVRVWRACGVCIPTVRSCRVGASVGLAIYDGSSEYVRRERAVSVRVVHGEWRVVWSACVRVRVRCGGVVAVRASVCACVCAYVCSRCFRFCVQQSRALPPMRSAA